MPIASFISSIVQLDLVPDSRGYVLFSLSNHDNAENLTCEYLVDLIEVTAAAMRWIVENCDEHKDGDRHLYYQFREAK